MKATRMALYLALAIFLYVIVCHITADVKEVRWHNAEHIPSCNGEITEKRGDFFVSESSHGFCVYVSEKLIEAHKVCRVCDAKESFDYKALTHLGIIKKPKKNATQKNFYAGDFGITIR